MYLNEDWFEDIVLNNEEKKDEKLPGPEVGVDTGLANMLLTLINGENSTIQDYNNFIANCTSHPEFIPVINDIAAEENNHVGMLQVLLKKLSPNAENIDDGHEEAHEIMSQEVE